MNFLNLKIEVLTGVEFLGSEPVDRATWICLMRYCAQHETGGRIKDAKEWGDRKWMQLCGVTKAEAAKECSLWSWKGDDLLVNHYPADQERFAVNKRNEGKKYGRGHRKYDKGQGKVEERSPLPEEERLPKRPPSDKDKDKDKDKNINTPPPPKGGEAAAGSFKTWTDVEFISEVEKANADGLLTGHEMTDFVEYWSEQSASGKPKRALEKTWDTRRRMERAVRVIYAKDRAASARADGAKGGERNLSRARMLDKQFEREKKEGTL